MSVGEPRGLADPLPSISQPFNTRLLYSAGMPPLPVSNATCHSGGWEHRLQAWETHQDSRLCQREPPFGSNVLWVLGTQSES